MMMMKMGCLSDALIPSNCLLKEIFEIRYILYDWLKVFDFISPPTLPQLGYRLLDSLDYPC